MYTLRLTRLAVATDGQTDFIDDEVVFDQELHAPPAQPAALASLGAAQSVAVMRADRDWGGDAFHPAPRRQLLTVISGAWQVITSRGAQRTFNVGDSLIVEDLEGPGHSSRALEDGSMALVTALADDQ